MVISDNKNITKLQMQVFIRLIFISKYAAPSNQCILVDALKEMIQTCMIQKTLQNNFKLHTMYLSNLEI